MANCLWGSRPCPPSDGNEWTYAGQPGSINATSAALVAQIHSFVTYQGTLYTGPGRRAKSGNISVARPGRKSVARVKTPPKSTRWRSITESSTAAHSRELKFAATMGIHAGPR